MIAVTEQEALAVIDRIRTRTTDRPVVLGCPSGCPLDHHEPPCILAGRKADR